MDERFAHLGSDPRFRPVPKKGQKVKIDNRFSSMFHDKKFKLKYSMDKRGRPVNNSTSDDLKRYYEMSSNSSSEYSSNDDEEHDNQINSSDDEKRKIEKKVKFSEDTKHLESDESDNSVNEDRDVKVDLARGIGNVESSSSDEDLSSDESSDEEEISHNWGELDREAPQDDNISTRLAICNMDWDRIKAVDLFILANSFKPADGLINSVKIYPSEYGLQRMKEEQLKGPTELVQETLKSDDEDYTETKEGSKYHMEKLRKYQLNRLKYFYAVLECDSQLTASKIYEELDGMEYESSAAQLDLRFVPDDLTFDHDPTSVCDSLPDLSTYQPVLFTTTALQQASVKLTWDETDPDRVRTIEKAFSTADEDEANLKNYLASSSEDEGFSSVDENQPSANQIKESQEPKIKEAKKSQSAIEKYKALLANLEEEEQKSKEKDVTLEISWEPGLKGKAENLLKRREKMKEATAFDEFLEKKKEKKKLQKEFRNQPAEKEIKDSSDEDGQAFSDDEVPSDLDLNEPFFKEEMEKIKNAKPKKKKLKNEKRGVKKDTDEGELELLTMDNDDRIDSNKHFNLQNLIDNKSKSKMKKERKLKKMNKLQTEDDFQVNVGDPRFTAIYESALFNIDPSDPNYKKTKGMQTFVEEKFKRRKQIASEVTPPNKIAKMNNNKEGLKINPSLSLLVNSVKNKSINYSKRKL